MFIIMTISTTTTKMIVESAHNAVLISVWEPLVALTTYVLIVSKVAGFV